jgi:hypothetical protein
MTIIADHTDLMTLLENNLTINNAILKVAQTAGTGDAVATLEELYRANQLILQALKSNSGIIHQIQQRNQLTD